MPIESKYVEVAAAIGFLLALFLTHGSLMVAVGILAFVAGLGWAVRQLSYISPSTTKAACPFNRLMFPRFPAALIRVSDRQG